MRIRQSMRRTHRRGRAEGANWLSFSDLMSSLLLMFILIMFYIMYQYFDMYEIKMAEIARQQYALDEANASLEEKTGRLSLAEQQMIAQQIKLEAAQNELTEAESVLAAQREELARAQRQLEEQEQEIADQRVALDVLSGQLDEKQAQISQQQGTLEEQQGTMDEQRRQLEQQQRTLEEQQRTLEEQQGTMDEQRRQLEQQQQTLADQQETLDDQRTRLEQQQQTLSDQQVRLDEQQQTLDDQQHQIEQLVGLRTRIITSLSNALREANISAQVDPANGSIALESNMLFEFGKSELTEQGKAFIDRFLPVYLDVLFSDEYLPYVSEVIIEGHTDSTGDYITNLKLSQDRARAVTAYVLGSDYTRLTGKQRKLLLKLVSTNGRSWSDLVYVNGVEDPDASRRVVFKFRMTDEQMIQQLKVIMEHN